MVGESTRHNLHGCYLCLLFVLYFWKRQNLTNLNILYAMLSVWQLLFLACIAFLLCFKGTLTTQNKTYASVKALKHTKGSNKMFWCFYVFCIRIIILFYCLLSEQFTETEFKINLIRTGCNYVQSIYQQTITFQQILFIVFSWEKPRAACYLLHI